MASPFTTFRKRQKTWLAVLGVLCMVAFVLNPAQCTGPDGPSPNTVVASTKYGDLSERELAGMRATARAVDEYLREVAIRTTHAMLREQKVPEQFQQQYQQRLFETIFFPLVNQGLILAFGENQISETEVIDTLLLERRANEMGLVVSDIAINDFLHQISQKKLTSADLESIATEVKVNPKQLFDGLRGRLMAMRVRQMFGYGLANAPPAQNWEYYLRLNRRARAEIVPIKVEEMVDQVPEPDDETVRKFFEEHKDDLRRPGSPEPGFKQPHQVALQYLKAEYEAFLDEEAITEEEIEEHYEKFKDTRYLFTEPAETPPASDDNGEKPASDENEKESTKSETEADNKKDSEKNESDKKDGQDDSKSDDCSSDEEPAKDDAKAETESDAKAQSKPEESQPVEPKPAAEQDADEPKADAETSDEPKEKSLLEISSELSLPRSVRDGPRPKYNPLWRVEKDIRRELAGQKAGQKISEAFRQIKPMLDHHFEDYGAWKSENAALPKDAQKPQPTPPNFAELADKHGLTAHETGLQSLYEIATETDVGKAIAEMGQRLQRSNYVEAALKMPLLYKAATVQDLTGNQYLYWKIRDVDEHVPELKDEGIRQQVVDAWKEIQARDLAKKKAEQLAEQAREAKSLSEVVADEKGLELIETQPFTWMTAGNPFLGPSEPRLTSVPGVESLGREFMSTVFGLEEGEVAVTHNVPLDAYYVVRLSSFEPSMSVLRQTFAAESQRQSQNFFALAQEENGEVARQWIESIRKDAGLHWNRPAAELAMRTR
jgi:hypothetical protein